MFFCDRDCFNCRFDDCRLPQNDVTGDEKRLSRLLDEKASLDNADNDAKHKLYVKKRAKESRREYWKKYHRERYQGINNRTYRKKVLRIGDEITEFESVTEAAASVGGYMSPISECCRGKRQSYYGYRWRYAD